ncbi:PglL family O-oligosaccharyltransferase [Variovorax sp. KBW07]|uniref:PglL family O-oligosaccharyltransferase n=1 Tax=Variovorax sp. KBW07 TaxID=2153358 RepID=UPI000F57BC3E|nr:O-antigen ligase family protein [Variovorax sp. KBW07]
MKRRLILFVGIVLGLAYLIPNHSPPWVVFHEDTIAAVAFLPLMVWGVGLRKTKPTIMLGVFFLALVPIAQLLSGQVLFASDSWLAALYLMGFAYSILAGTRITSEPAPQQNLALAGLAPLFACFIFSGLLSVAVAIHQWLDLGILGLYVVDMRFGGRPYANLAQPNQLATLLLLGELGLIFMFEMRFIRAPIAFVGAMMLAFGLAMTQSRSVLMALLFFWIAFLGLRARASLRTRLLPLSIVTAFYACIAWKWLAINEKLLLSGGTSLAERLNQDLRITIWGQMLDAITRAPWLGYGWNQVPIAQKLTALDHPATHHYFTSAHNFLVDLAIWCGLPIAVFISAGLVAWFIAQIKYCRDPLSWCALVAVLLVFGHSLVEFPLYYAYFLLPVGLLMGALQVNLPRTQCWNIKFPNPVLWAGGGAVFALFFAIVSEYPGWEQEWQRVRFEKARIGTRETTAPPRAFILTEFPAVLKFARTDPTRDMQAEDINEMRRVVERFGWANNLFKYALVMGLNGEPKEAEDALARLCKMHTERNCREARETWLELATEKYPELGKIKLPELGN